MYAASAGSSSCSLVDAGFYVAATGASSMAACEPGSYSGSGASACTACEQGRYTASFAQSSCALSYVVWTARELRAGDADARHKIFASKHYLLLLLSFCVLPGAAATTLQYFGCSRYDLGEFEEDSGDGWRRQSEAGQDKRATFPTLKAPISVVSTRFG